MKAKIKEIITSVREHVPGTGCECYARHELECSCRILGLKKVDWRCNAEVARDTILKDKTLSVDEIRTILRATK